MQVCIDLSWESSLWYWVAHKHRQKKRKFSLFTYFCFFFFFALYKFMMRKIGPVIDLVIKYSWYWIKERQKDRVEFKAWNNNKNNAVINQDFNYSTCYEIVNTSLQNSSRKKMIYRNCFTTKNEWNRNFSYSLTFKICIHKEQQCTY